MTERVTRVRPQRSQPPSLPVQRGTTCCTGTAPRKQETSPGIILKVHRVTDSASCLTDPMNWSVYLTNAQQEERVYPNAGSGLSGRNRVGYWAAVFDRHLTRPAVGIQTEEKFGKTSAHRTAPETASRRLLHLTSSLWLVRSSGCQING